VKRLILVGMTVVTLAISRPSLAGIEYTDLSYDFGHVALDFTVIATYTLYNTGPDPVSIDSVRVNCDCSQAFAIDSLLQPGDTTTVRLSFTTTNFFGPNNKQLTVYTSDPKHPKINLFYLSVVGQWLNGIKPDPYAVFFLPPHKRKEIVIPNVKFDRIEIALAGQVDTLYDVKVTRPRARKGESVAAEIVPRPGLRGGTYYSNLRLQIIPSDGDSVYLTIPVKIVRY
jgi:hypothetical protein